MPKTKSLRKDCCVCNFPSCEGTKNLVKHSQSNEMQKVKRNEL